MLPPLPCSIPLACSKKKAVHKTTSTDDKRLQSTLKRLGVNTIPGIEEVRRRCWWYTAAALLAIHAVITLLLISCSWISCGGPCVGARLAVAAPG